MFPILLQHVDFAPSGRRILAGVDLAIGADGVSAVLGPNGAGKSVLLKTIAGLLPLDGGSLSWGGATDRPEGIAFMFQTPVALRASVADNVALGIAQQSVGRDEARVRVASMLERVGLAHRARESARLLSGGERQRMALARAWITRPGLLLLDEPTAALDPTATAMVERLIGEIRSEGVRIVMTTHNLGQAQRLADEVIFLADGQVRERAPTARFFARPESAEARLFINGELPWRVAFES
jgi:tungstate transport system ATP-binding protein